MITQTFEIKVALLGHVSVGKTTVLNALLQDKFSEVSKRRTTAGINFFKIASQPSNGTRVPATVTTIRASEDAQKDPTAAAGGANDVQQMEWSILAEDEVSRTAESTIAEITVDNKKLREQKATIQEKEFNIELKEALCKMRKDTTLVIVDVPGLNEAGSKKMYSNYVSDQWDTFDCAIVVMDSEKGVNTEEEVELLQFVKKMMREKKDIPVIILCNKVDDPDDSEILELVGEIRTKVEQIFDVGSRTESLQHLLTAVNQGKRSGSRAMYPIFIPVSAGNAFAYRTAANCSMEKFMQLDIKLIDKLGGEEFGKFKWKKLPLAEKYKLVYEAVSDRDQYVERLEATHFDKFLSALSYCIGGEKVQCDLLEEQVKVALNKLSLEHSPIAVQLRQILDRSKVLSMDLTPLKLKFWKLYNEAISKSYVASDKLDPAFFLELLNELIAYSDIASQAGWVEEHEKIVHEMEELVRRQIFITLEMEQDWKIDNSVLGKYDCETFEKTKPGGSNVTWKTLTYHDWVTIMSSLLLMSHNRHFYERLAHEKILLESRLQRHLFYANGLATGRNEAEKKALANIPVYMQGRFKDGKFVPTDPLKYKAVVQIVNPKLLSDPMHWGHLVWTFCNFMDKAEKTN